MPWRTYTAPTGMDNLTALWAFAPDDVWVGGSAMLHFDGHTFTQVQTPSLDPIADLWGFAPNDLYAVSFVDLLHWDGAAWSVVDTAGAIDPIELTAVWGTSGNDLWLGDAQNGRVFHWDGVAWSTGISQVVSVADLWGVAGGSVYAVGVADISRFNGGVWTSIADDVADQGAGVWGFGDNDVWAASDFGGLFHWDGTAWTDTLPIDDPNFSNDSHNSIWGSAPDNVWAVGDFGAVSHWDGARWTQTQVGAFPYFPFLTKVHGSSADDIWVVGRASDPNAKGLILHHTP